MRKNPNTALTNTGMETVVHALLDLKHATTLNGSEWGRNYAIIRLVTIMEQFCRLVRRGTENPPDRNTKTPYQKSLLLNAMNEYNLQPEDWSSTYEKALEEYVPGDGTKVNLTFNELEDLLRNCMREHYITGLAEHVEASGIPYQGVFWIERALKNFCGINVFDEQHYGRRAEMHEMFELRHGLVHTLEGKVGDIFAYVGLVYGFVSYVLDETPMLDRHNSFMFYEGTYYLNAGDYERALSILEKGLERLKSGEQTVVNACSITYIYYNIARALKSVGKPNDALEKLDEMVETMARSCIPVLKDGKPAANTLYAVDRAVLMGKAGIMRRDSEFDDSAWWFDKAIELCGENRLAYLFLASEFVQAGEKEYADACYEKAGYLIGKELRDIKRHEAPR